MTSSHAIGILPVSFASAVHDLSSFHWDKRIHIQEREPPSRIAPFAAAIEADIDPGDHMAHGRLILLHDPCGQESWGGDFRCVTYAQAEVSPEMIHDPFLADVGWSWLTDALAACGADAVGECGTVTTTSSTPFGTKSEEEQRSHIEIRASWTPLLDADHPFSDHLQAWQELLREISGLPPQDPRIIPLPTRAAQRR